MKFTVLFITLFTLAITLPAQKLRQLESGGVVPNQYILELRGEPALKDASKRTAVRQSQLRLSTRLRANGIITLDRTENVANLLMVNVPADGSVTPDTILASNPEVTRVYQVRKRKMLLDRAAQVHGLTQAWEKIGKENAGKGIRVAVIDSGVDVAHPAFQVDPATFPAPEGFPKANTDADLVNTNNKVIVARSYATLFDAIDPDQSARDHVGHGTALASCIGAIANAGPNGTFTGMAPAAYIGSYKIFGTPGVNDGANDASILKAIDDAVADGMDILNLSIGASLPSTPENDPYYPVSQRLEAANILLVVAAGNEGPDPGTLSTPGSMPTALTVGASFNSRTFYPMLSLTGGKTYWTNPGSAAPSSGVVTGPLVAAESVGADSLGCAAYPANSMKGKIAIIARGTCTFDVKITNAAVAGAVGAVIYNNSASGTVSMLTSVVFPAVGITQADGKALIATLAKQQDAQALLSLGGAAADLDPKQLTDFSSVGELYGIGIKPDLLAVGQDVSMATQKLDRFGDMYSSDGYITADGTSFATPITAGTLAMLKAARPGLTAADYRSLLVNTTISLVDPTLSVMQTGSGFMQANEALTAELTFSPLSVNVTASSHTIKVKNISGAPVTYKLTTSPIRGDAPQLSVATLTIDKDTSATFDLKFDIDNLSPGVYEGYVFLESDSGKKLRVPYWFGKPGDPVTFEYSYSSTGPAGQQSGDLLFIRILDKNSVTVLTKPTFTVASGTGQVKDVVRRDDYWAGTWAPVLVLGPGRNVISIDAGNNVTFQLAITGR